MMKRRTIIRFGAILGSAMLAVIAVTYTWVRSSPDLHFEPFTASMELGPVIPASDYRLSGPYTHDNLTVYLIHGPETLTGASFLTLQEGLEQKTAVVHETGSVNELAVENQSATEELFIQSGDIVKGGKQDRTLPYDAVIGPHSGRVPVASFCVEQGRWKPRGEESSFSFESSSSSLSTVEMKRAAKAPGEASQGAVWKNVAKTQERLRAKLGVEVKSAESASSLQLTLESPQLRAAMAPYLSVLGPATGGRDDAIGYVTVVNGRVLSADVYASGALFRKVRPKLLDGSAVEAFIEAEPGRVNDPVREDAVRAFLVTAETGESVSEAVTERTYVQVRQTNGAMVFNSCDRSRGNLVLHRSYLTR
ncbi:MAG: hypothetical protein JWO38_418 [Gemmataceae bacterium]|nr:hypothetical protein [Gemmataceae bacterium]